MKRPEKIIVLQRYLQINVFFYKKLVYKKTLVKLFS